MDIHEFSKKLHVDPKLKVFVALTMVSLATLVEHTRSAQWCYNCWFWR